MEAIGWREAALFVHEHIRNTGPYDGLCGFSQGAALIALLCLSSALDQDYPLEERLPSLSSTGVRFVMLFGGYLPEGLPSLAKVDCEWAIMTDMPSLQVWGQADKQVPSGRSEKLSKIFKTPTLLVHAGGHYIPTNHSERALYRNFVGMHRTGENRSILSG